MLEDSVPMCPAPGGSCDLVAVLPAVAPPERLNPHNQVTLRGVNCMQASDQVLPTRIIHLPMAFNDKWTNGAIAKYMKSVRAALGLFRDHI